jgi:hypothetical protein
MKKIMGCPPNARNYSTRGLKLDGAVGQDRTLKLQKGIILAKGLNP